MLATLLLVVGGAYGAAQLNQELLPETDLPMITVVTPVAGAGPGAVDEQVTGPIESAISGVEGLEETRGTSLQGASAVQAEFGYDVDLEEAEAEVRGAVDGVALPGQAAEPEVEQVSPDQFPIEVVSISADGGDGGEEGSSNGDDEELGGYSDDDLRGLTDYVEGEVVPGIEDVEGVEGVDVIGGSERVVEVELDPERLQENGLSAAAVLSALQGSAVDLPVGAARVEGDTITTPVRAENELAGVEALAELPVLPGASAVPAAPTAGAAPSTATTGGSAGALAGTTGGGSQTAPPGPVTRSGVPVSSPAPAQPVPLGDVANISVVDSTAAGVSRTDGEPSLTLNVDRTPGANVVEVTGRVGEVLDGVEADLGGEGQVRVVARDADLVGESVNDLILKAIVGAAVAVLVISLFLRSWRAVLIVAVSLPTSVLAALLLSWGAGVTLNIITMGGLVVAIGRVVDDAIVVLENSYRYLQKGHDPDEATLRGTTEVAGAITSSTLTSVAVFLPLALVGGLVSQLFLPLALTVTFALLASLVVAVTIIPVLISLFLRRREAGGSDPEEDGGYGEHAGNEEREGALVRLYLPALRWGLGHRGAVLLLAAGVFAAGIFMVTLLPSSFFPKIESETVLAEVELAEGTTLGATSEELREFEAFLEDEPGVEGYQVQVGGETAGADLGGGGSTIRPENRADVTVAVEDGAGVSDVQSRIEEGAEDLYGAGSVAVSLRLPAGAGSEDVVEATITGGSAREREEAAGLVAAEMEDNGSVEDVESSLSGGAPQVGVLLNEERAAEAGLTPGAAAQSLAALFGAQAGPGTPAATVDGLPVTIGVPEESLGSLDAVRGLPLGPGTAVADVAEVEEAESPSQVVRVDGDEAVTVTGSITAEDISGVTAQVQAAVADLDLPGDTEVGYGGTSEQAEEGFADLLTAIVVAIALVYLILVFFFGSALSPLVILLSLPLTTAGAFGAMALGGAVLSIPAMLGVLLLVGIVVANAILLVDFAQQAEKRGASPDDAIVEAGRARLRPVLMTALATVGALLPLALGIGSGSVLITSGLAIPVIGGLLTSTLLTLLVVPAGYSLARGATERLGERLGRRPARGRQAAEEDGTPRRGLPAGQKRPHETVGAGAAGNGGGGPEAAGRGEGVAGPSGRASHETDGSRNGAGDGHSFELGRALGRIEVLERELGRRELELAEERQRKPGGLKNLLRRR